MLFAVTDTESNIIVCLFFAVPIVKAVLVAMIASQPKRGRHR
jgi:hypothetical protein